MLQFCPACSNSLVVEKAEGFRFKCRTCFYYYPLDRKVQFTHRVRQFKSVEIFEQGADDATLPVSEALCPRCGNKTAFYEQRQTRSADEAATTFYTCTSKACGHKWRQD